MTTFIRVIKPVSSAVEAIPSGAIAWNGLVDYVIPGTKADIPEHAVYAAYLEEGVYSVVVQAPASFNFFHHFAGWDPESWPYPS